MLFDLVTRNNGSSNLMSRNNLRNWMFRPNRGVSEFLGAFDDLFNDFTSYLGTGKEFNVDVKESDIGYELSAELPGISKDDIDIKLENGVLLISCERSNTTEEDSRDFKLRERKWGKFSRSFQVPNIDENSIEANLTNGVLTVTMKKVADEKRKIDIKVS